MFGGEDGARCRPGFEPPGARHLKFADSAAEQSGRTPTHPRRAVVASDLTLRTVHGLRRIGAYVAAGTVGVVGAHVAAYATVFPHAHERAEHLHATGHSYWPAATALAGLAAVGVVGLALRTGHRRAAGEGWRTDLSGGRLAPFQVAMFAGIEVVERLVAGAPLADLAHGAEFFVGLGVQVVASMLVCRLFRTVAHVAERISSRRRGVVGDSVAARLPPAFHAGFGSSGSTSPVGSRAPPSLAVI